MALAAAAWAVLLLWTAWGALENPVDSFGFLGGAYPLLMLALGGSLTALAAVAGRRGRATAVLAALCACLAGLLAANHFHAAGQFVDGATYDREAAYEMSRAREGDLAYGYEHYRPFTSGLIARLDGESDLRFGAGDRLPRVDSATALLPLASAFVTAAYPEESTTVSWDLEAYEQGYVSGYFDGYDAGFVEGGGEVDEDARDSLGAGDRPASELGGARAEGYAAGYGDGRADGLAVGAAGAEWRGDEYWEGMDYDGNSRPGAGNLSLSAEPATFQFNNSSEGFTELADGNTDVFFGTKSDAEQEAYARGRGVEFEYTPVGREGFVFLVNASNPVESLTVEQVKGIYSGRITNWREVGGADEPITAYQRNANSGSQSMMERFMDGEPLADAPATVAMSMGGLVRSVADYDNGSGAIGYSFRYYATDLVGDYDVKLLSIEGVEPTLDNISSGAYPVTGDFYAVTRAGDGDENLRRLVEWAQGDQGQELVEKSGYARLG